MYGTALGTAVLALATFHMAQYTRKMIQESVYERGQARAIEFVALVIYNVGDGCYAPGLMGTTGAVDGARRAAEAIRKRFKPGK